MIPRDTIDRIFSAAHIEDVVGQYVRLKKRGANLIGLCPFHTEKTGSFTVSPSKGIYKCFGCGKSGHVAQFVMEIEQCSYVEALRMLAKKYGIPIEERELTEDEKQQQDNRESMFVINEFAGSWFEQQLWDTEAGRAIGLTYFRERGLLDETIRKYHLGYSPQKGNPLTDALRAKGFAEQFIISNVDTGIGTGLVGKSEDGRLYDRFRDRVIFPIHTLSGKTVAFAGRILKAKENTGKYVNSPDSIIYSKTRELYGMYQAKQSISRLDRCYLVEGQMDVLSLYQAGIQNVVSSGGTALTKEQIRLIHRFTNNITVVYDGDAAGIHAALRGIDMCLEEGLDVQVLLLPDGHDPDSFARSMDASLLLKYFQEHTTDFIRYKASLLLTEAGNDPLKRSKALTDILRSIAIEPDQVKRGEHVKLCAAISGSNEQDLNRVMTRERRKYLDNKLQQPQQPQQTADNTQRETSPAVVEKEETPDVSLMYTEQDRQIRQRNEQIDNNFFNLIKVLIKDGKKVIYENEEGEVTAEQYIFSQLSQDNIVPSNPVFRSMMQTIEERMDDSGFDAVNYFQYNENTDISQTAIKMLNDPYQLSRMYEVQYISENITQKVSQQESQADLLNQIITIILELKFSIINLQIDQLQLQLNTLSGNTEMASAAQELLIHQFQLMQIRAQIANALGNRVTS